MASAAWCTLDGHIGTNGPLHVRASRNAFSIGQAPVLQSKDEKESVRVLTVAQSVPHRTR